MSTRSIGVVTTGRSDYSLLTPVFRALTRRRRVRARWFVTGMHLSRRLGYSVDQVMADGWGNRVELVEAMLDGDSPAATAISIGATVEGFGRALARATPDMLVILGDRFETLGVAAAALPFRIPIAHIHGGETTEGAFDDGVRHALTKLSHLHFVSHPEYARRVRQLGEEPWRITMSGAPGLDRARSKGAVNFSDISRVLGEPLNRGSLLITYHPETLRPERSLRELEALLIALGRLDVQLIFTAPNADPGRDAFASRISAFVQGGPRRALIANLGHRYFSLLAKVGALVGNSSSGIIETPSFGLPTVNIGDRQRGRIRARNVIDVSGSSHNIERAIRNALTPAFRAQAQRVRNPYGDGRAADRIARVLATVPLDDRLLIKRFADARHR